MKTLEQIQQENRKVIIMANNPKAIAHKSKTLAGVDTSKIKALESQMSKNLAGSD